MANITIDNLFDSPYSLASQTIKKVCGPLFRNFGINYFDYACFYPDNTCFTFFTEPEYVKFFLQTAAYQEPPPFLMPQGRYLWSGYIPASFLSAAQKEFSYCHGLTVIRNHANYKELFNFSAPAHESQVLNLYLNKMPTLELFVDYFLSEVASLIDKHRQNRLILPGGIDLQPEELTDPTMSFLEEIHAAKKVRKDNQLFSINNQLLSLSPREMECINLLKQGLGNKHIARHLDISYRTVEKFLKKIYEKSGIDNRSELLLQMK